MRAMEDMLQAGVGVKTARTDINKSKPLVRLYSSGRKVLRQAPHHPHQQKRRRRYHTEPVAGEAAGRRHIRRSGIRRDGASLRGDVIRPIAVARTD